MAVQTSAEAVKALCINLDGLEDYLMNAKKNGMTFAVFRGKRNVGVQDFQDRQATVISALRQWKGRRRLACSRLSSAL
jgi:predicted phage tail protein